LSNSEAKLIEAEKLDNALPIYPALITCADSIHAVCEDLVDPLFTSNLKTHFSLKSIHSVGDLAQLTEREVNRLPIKLPKLDCIKKALTRYEERLAIKTPDRRPTPNVSSSTPLNKGRKGKKESSEDAFEMDDMDVSAVYEYQKPVKRPSMDSCMQTSPVKKSKREEEKACKDMMDQCDDDFLFQSFINRFGAAKILQGYKVSFLNLITEYFVHEIHAISILNILKNFTGKNEREVGKRTEKENFRHAWFEYRR